MNIPSNIAKSIILSTCIFWIINFTHDFNLDIMPLILLSVIPISICVTLVILTTICPIFWMFKNEDESNITIIKKYFPYYTIIVFSLCAFGIIALEFEIYFLSFFTTVFFTTAQSWLWFAKEEKI